MHLRFAQGFVFTNRRTCLISDKVKIFYILVHWWSPAASLKKISFIVRSAYTRKQNTHTGH